MPGYSSVARGRGVVRQHLSGLWLAPADTNSALIYDSRTDTGCFLMALDNDVYDTFESGVILVGSHWDVDAAR